MTSQPSLWRPIPTAPYQPTSDTSKAAAESIRPCISNLQQRVLRYLAQRGPAIDQQISEGARMAYSTVNPRRGELVELGFVRDTGQRGFTHSGRTAVLWEITAKGRDVLESYQT